MTSTATRASAHLAMAEISAKQVPDPQYLKSFGMNNGYENDLTDQNN